MADEIVVTGKVPGSSYDPRSTTDPYYYAYSGSGSQASYLEYAYASGMQAQHKGNAATVTYHGTNAVVLSTVVPLYQQEANNLNTKINNTGPITFFLSDGKTTNMIEIADIAHKFGFNLTEGVNYPAGYGGETHYDTSTGMYISNEDAVSTAAGYASHGAAGVDFIEIHEMVHNTVAATQFAQTEFTSYMNSHNQDPSLYAQSSEFDAVERYDNDITRAVLQHMNVAVANWTGHGF